MTVKEFRETLRRLVNRAICEEQKDPDGNMTWIEIELCTNVSTMTLGLVLAARLEQNYAIT